MKIPNAYVTCRHCGLPAEEISRQTSYEYAYHVKCRPSEREKTAERIAKLKEVKDHVG